MADNSVNYNRAALTASKGMAAGSIPKAMMNGQLRCSVEEFIADGTAGVVNLGPALPKDAIVLGFIINAADNTGTVTVSIGDANTADLYLPAGTSVDNTSSFVPAKVSTFSGGATADDYLATYTAGLGYRIGSEDNDEQLQVTFNGTTATEIVTIVTIFAV